eukprot:scaffold20339_cov128-Cylindrotheca_fusiformis.AAC.8
MLRYVSILARVPPLARLLDYSLLVPADFFGTDDRAAEAGLIVVERVSSFATCWGDRLDCYYYLQDH